MITIFTTIGRVIIINVFEHSKTSIIIFNFQKPYACQVAGCRKRYTDPSSLRKHIKNHAGSTMCKNKKLVSTNQVYCLFS